MATGGDAKLRIEAVAPIRMSFSKPCAPRCQPTVRSRSGVGGGLLSGSRRHERFADRRDVELALLEDSPALPLGRSAPHAVINAVGERIFETRALRWAGLADTFRDFNTDTIAGKECRGWFEAAIASCHPFVVHCMYASVVSYFYGAEAKQVPSTVKNLARLVSQGTAEDRRKGIDRYHRATDPSEKE